MGRFLLSETRYPPDLRTPWHAHEAPAFCLVLSGRYIQRFHGREVVYQPATALFRPAGAEHAEFRSPEVVTHLALEGLVLALGAEFARIAGPRRGRRCPLWLLRTREALDAGFTTRVRLAALAAEAGVHPVYLAVAFRNAFGTSVGEYVRARRIKAAQLALRESGRSINEIALTLGFSSQSHFTRVFRTRTGLTPLAYRHLHAKA